MNFVSQRIEICRACPESQTVALKFLQCKQCSCIIQTKAMVPWAACPLNLWPATVSESDTDDVLINDAYIGLMMPDSAYKQAVTKKFYERFGAGADLEVLYQDLVNRNTKRGN